MMEQNKDTTIWGGVSLLLALADSSELARQAIVVILFPTIGWLMLYFVKKITAYLEICWKVYKENKNNNQ